MVAGVGRQLLFEHARVEAGLDRQHALGDQRLALFLDVERRRPLYGWVLAQNIGSQRVLEKCGFTVIGEEHEDGDHGIIFMLSGPPGSTI